MSILVKRFYDFIIKFQIYIVILYSKYCTIFASVKPFEDELNKKKKKSEIKKQIKPVVKFLKSTEQPIERPIELSIERPIERPKKEQLEEELLKQKSQKEDQKNEELNEQSIDDYKKEQEDDSKEDNLYNEKINKINENLKETLNNLSFSNIDGNLRIYKNIFNEIIKKCREKVLFLCNKKIFTDIKNLTTYKNTYIKINNFYDIVDNIPRDKFKIDGNKVEIESFVDKNNMNTGTEIFIIKDPVYNFIYSIRCNIEKITEENYLEDNPAISYLKNDGFKEKYIYKKKLYFYLNEIEDEKNKEQIKPSRYLIFFRYILSLLDESDIICSKIDSDNNKKFFVENIMEMEVLTSIGVDKNNPIRINSNTEIVEGLRNKK